MRFDTLEQWLSWQETLHPTDIEMGLARIQQVFRALHPDPLPFIVISVAGTNGKGSSIALLESILLAAGYRVGAYTSPHLLRYNERIHLDGAEVDDQSLVDSFARIDAARENTSLTFFEFGTLAALDIFIAAKPDVVLLEVGLGGRLDAVNIIDADVALITSIGLDHTQWLGNDRESIAMEKAGIMRTGQPVVCSDATPPQAIEQHAAELGAGLYQLHRDFSYSLNNTNGDHFWQWQGPSRRRSTLPPPLLKGEHQYHNAAGVLMVLEVLADRLPVNQAQVRQGLHNATLAGRFQIIEGAIPVILDVAHNLDSARQLADLLASQHINGRTHAIIGMMADKDLNAVLSLLSEQVSLWYACDLTTERAADKAQLAEALRAVGALNIHCCESVSQALDMAKKQALNGDRIIVFGSFYTVADALQQSV